jgi:glycine/serine hydroxymethyltransferase
MKENDMETIAEIMSIIIDKKDTIDEAKVMVKDLCEKFPLY